MRNKFRNILLVVLGVIIGVFASVQFSAMAQKQTAPLPLDELRQLADVFGLNTLARCRHQSARSQDDQR